MQESAHADARMNTRGNNFFSQQHKGSDQNGSSLPESHFFSQHRKGSDPPNGGANRGRKQEQSMLQNELSLAMQVVIGDWIPLVFVAGAIPDWLGLQRSLEATVDARDHRGFLGVLVF